MKELNYTKFKALTGMRIKMIREASGLSQKEFGERLDTSASIVSRWERGVQLPNKDRLKKIADMADMSVNELVYGDVKTLIEANIDIFLDFCGYSLEKINTEGLMFDIVYFLDSFDDIAINLDDLNPILVMFQNRFKKFLSTHKMNKSEELLIESEGTNISGAHAYKVFPVSISAGALENVDAISRYDYDEIYIADIMLGKYAAKNSIIVLKVNGDSMNRIIPHGSYIIVDTAKKQVSDIKDSDIVVFSESNAYSVKRFFNDFDNKRFLFKPDSDNELFTTIEVKYESSTNLRLIGKVIRYLVDVD